MKQLFLSVFAIICIAAASCKKHDIDKQHPATIITYIGDTTDTRNAQPAIDAILELYQLAEFPEQEANFRLSTISDRQLESGIEFHLPAGEVTEQQNKRADPRYRGKLILAFYSKVRKTYFDYCVKCAMASPTEYSECFAVISHELELLAGKRGTKYLVVHSDLRERSATFDSYSPYGKKLMKTSKDKIADTLLHAHPLPADLSGITVKFQFTGRDRDEEAAFLLMAEVYKLLLLPRRAIVIVQSAN